MDKKNLALIITLSSLGAVFGEELFRRIFRKRGETKLQQKVTDSMPEDESEDVSLPEDFIQITKVDKDSVDLSKCKAIPIDENEANEWKTFLFDTVSEATKTGLAFSAIDGLVKSNLPLEELCKVKDNPAAMRGFVIEDGKISEHVELTDAGIANIAPLLVYQCMAAVTSQYYQQVITERLDTIDSKLDNIVRILEAEDRAKLKVSFKRLLELSKKSTYDLSDKIIVSDFLNFVEIIREKYNALLSGITPESLKGTWMSSDLKEAKRKVELLKNSQYFEYLEMAMQAEVLVYIATVVMINVAHYLGNEEDVRTFVNRLNLNFWGNYVNQFNKIKHEVLKYIELELASSWVNTDEIAALKTEVASTFDLMERNMHEMQDRLAYNTTQYIELGEDGKMVRYLLPEGE